MAKILRELLILRGHYCYCIGSISHHKGDTLGPPPIWRGGPESRGVREPIHARAPSARSWAVAMSSRRRGGDAEERSHTR